MTTFMACGGSSSGTGKPVAPSNLAYSQNPATFTKGVTISSDSPSTTGGAVTSYSISPALPAGLRLDTVSGVISGTPTAITPPVTYTVTATNSGGSATANLILAVIDVAPSALTYTYASATFTKGVTISSDSPSTTGGAVTSYSISPALPAGLRLDTVSGVISGTPTAITPPVTYTVTATNSGGGATANLTFIVISSAPVNLVYIYNSSSFTVGVPIQTDSPSSSGGAVISYSVSPALPAGISLDTSTGAITGTPTAITPPNAYIVTAKNASGSADAYLFFSVIPPGPTITTQPASAWAFSGQAVTFTVSVSGTGPFTYQWQLNGATIYGATSSSYLAPPVTLENNGQRYLVIVQDAYGSQAMSLAATLTVTAGTTRFTNTGSLTARERHSSTLLANGMVLIAGGQNNSNGMLASAELYDPSTGSFIATGGMNSARAYHTATLLPNGKVLVTGGVDQNGYASKSAELYDAALGTWTPTGSMGEARTVHTATLLPNGLVLIAGGIGSTGSVSGAELYDPSMGKFSPTGSLNYAYEFFTATLLPSGKVLIVEALSGGNLIKAELYDSTSGTFTETGSPNVARVFFTATILPSGAVLLVGGSNSASPAACELYDPAAGNFSLTGNLNAGRGSHTATRLPDGKVLIAGGRNTNGALASAEIYDPVAGTFTYTASLNTRRGFHAATLLPNGKVLITGGANDLALPTIAELYDPLGPLP